MEGIMRKNLRYYLFFLFFALVVLAVNSTVQAGAQRKKVLMIIAHRDFQDKEFNIPKKTFKTEIIKAPHIVSRRHVCGAFLPSKVDKGEHSNGS